MAATKCIIILSEKSSGSSACQNILASFADIKHVAKTRHYENETLYWTKAASVLGLPQQQMIDSEVPIHAEQAREELITLLEDNLGTYEPPHDDRKMIFDGWKALCRKHTPIFLEKSPHHLCQWMALRLIYSCMQETEEDIEFLCIGLIRNPMDTVYSQFQRWRSRPEEVQYQWLNAYQNLLRFKQLVGEKLVILRYEDMVSSLNFLQPVFDFCEIDATGADRNFFHRQSLLKWRKDFWFGFQLDPKAIALARQYGYLEADMRNRSNFLWPLYREFARAKYKLAIWIAGKLPRAAATRLKSLRKA